MISFKPGVKLGFTSTSHLYSQGSPPIFLPLNNQTWVLIKCKQNIRSDISVQVVYDHFPSPFSQSAMQLIVRSFRESN